MTRNYSGTILPLTKWIGTVFILLFVITGYSQTSIHESNKIVTYIKVWGFLKYYHPKVAKGKLDWDKEFTSHIRILKKLESKPEINTFYQNWIAGLGKIKPHKTATTQIPDSLKLNLDLAWLNDSSLFTDTVIQQLQFIFENRNQGKNYYVQQNRFVGNTRYQNEKIYKDSVFPTEELRLLGLSRYWNIINYFYPYKYKIGKDWNEVLLEMIPKFKDSKDTMSYHLAMLELTASINDSHSGFITRYTIRYFGYKCVPFSFKIINNKAIVTGILNDSLCKKDDIHYGDVFSKVDNRFIEDIIREKYKYISGSNEATKLRNMYYAIFNGQTDSVTVTFERNGIISEKTISRYFFREFNYKRKDSIPEKPYKILEGNIGYLNLGILKTSETLYCLNQLKETKAIIIDVRNYPKGTMYKIAKFLNADVKPFALFTAPDLSYPGVYRFTPPYYCGKKNNNPYKGKVILLFNELTQSHAEFTLMGLQTAPEVISIGSQTAGADGNVSQIIFPGNYNTTMTGIGVYYPDGKETQRVGIIPDIEIKPTIEGIRLHRDEVLEKAIELLNKN